MAIMLVVSPQSKIYLRTILYGVGRAEDDSELRANFRLIAASVLAHWSDSNPDLSGVRGDIFDVLTAEPFYQKGYAKTSGERLWFCSYIGFEKITSTWAKTNHPDCKGYLCIRIYNQDSRHNELEFHTIQIYF